MPDGAPNQEFGRSPQAAGSRESAILTPAEERPDQLNSWKDIAVYLNRDVRTVRRWEKDQGLPVHRHQHKRGASVYAYRAELDAWWNSGKEHMDAVSEAREETHETQELPVSSDAPLAPAKDHVIARVALVILAAIGLGWLGLWSAARFRAHPSADKIVLAVLPFDDMSGEPQEYLSDGLTEEMI